MSKRDPFDDPTIKAYLRRAQADMFPKLKESALSLTILGADPDPKLCLELGAAILFDKPILVIVPEGVRVPANLKRCAAAIVYGDPHDPSVEKQIRDALADILKNDQRSGRTS